MQPIGEKADVVDLRVRGGHFGKAGRLDALEIVDPVQNEKPVQIDELGAKTPRQRHGFAKVVEKLHATPLGPRPAKELGRVQERIAMILGKPQGETQRTLVAVLVNIQVIDTGHFIAPICCAQRQLKRTIGLLSVAVWQADLSITCMGKSFGSNAGGFPLYRRALRWGCVDTTGSPPHPDILSTAFIDRGALRRQPVEALGLTRQRLAEVEAARGKC